MSSVTLPEPTTTAMAYATTSFPVAPIGSTVGEIRRNLLGGRRYESAADVVIVDREVLAGLVRIEDLLAEPEERPVREVMDADPPVIAPGLDQEAVAWKAVDHGEGALAVVDENGRCVGLVPPWQMLRVLLREHDEDLARLSGYLHQTETARSAMVEPVARRLWHRLPWLIVGLAAAMASAAILGAFEGELESDVALAFFIPGIVYIADAVGTQTEAVVVRGLSVDAPVTDVAVREIVTGAVIGATLAVVALPLVLVWARTEIAVAVALSIFAASTVATTVAMLLPWALWRRGADPAFGSGPLATVVQDLLSLAIYLGVVVAVV